MANFRSFSEIVSTIIQRLNLTQPNLDTKPGSVARDLFVDLPADQLAALYEALAAISEKQSLASAVGSDLDRLAANFGLSRNTGSVASGIAIFCTNTLVSDIPIPSGTGVSSRSGIQFRTVGNFLMSNADRNRLAANATRIRKSLNLAGINATYAIEIPIQAIRPGTSANLGSLQIVDTDLQYKVVVTNITATSGGANRESDDAFRSRILSVFSGANIGTSSGYRNTALGVTGVSDALVVEPGNSLMLRDGTETIQLDDGSFRILNSGTGGKVDIYALGRQIEEINESFIFSDLSGVGNISDERNDIVLGQSNQDPTRTIEERRVIAFNTGNLPNQPVDSINTLIGSASGILTEKYTDVNGKIRGNYEIIKDINPDSGGSPFGFDKIHFISNIKEVEKETLVKKQNYSVDPLPFTDITKLSKVYTEINELNENSSVSTAGNKFIQLLHTPVVRVSRVENKTTGEVYSVVSQNLNNQGLNESGLVEISGNSLPTVADILNVNYTWQQVYDPYVDYGSGSVSQFKDPNANDSIDWSSSGGIFEETSLIQKSQDGLQFEIPMEYTINKVISVYTKTTISGTISIVQTIENVQIPGIIIPNDEAIIANILSIKKTSNNLEIYNTKKSDGKFASRTIYLPSDAVASVGDVVTIEYNKIEFYDIESSDGSSYNNVVVLPSDSTLQAFGIFDDVEAAYLGSDNVYVKYVGELTSIFGVSNLTDLPVTGIDTSNRLFGGTGIQSTLSNQPIFWEYSNGIPNKISRFGPTNIRMDVSGIPKAGKIKVSGTSLNRYELTVLAGNIKKDALIYDLEAEMKSTLGLTTLPTTMGIARLDSFVRVNSSGDTTDTFDLLGTTIYDNKYDIGSSQSSSSLSRFRFIIPQTPNNNLISINSGDTLKISFLMYNENENEELFFGTSGTRVTKNRYGRIRSISVSSGFRNASGNISGSVSVLGYSQPTVNQNYFSNYEFLAPKEGERLSVSYNINRLILDVTRTIETVRPITADVLVKEAGEILVDVSGTLLINDNSTLETSKIVENVINAVTNLLNTSTLAPTVDYSDVIAVAAGQNGVDSVNISLFNESGKTGRRAFIKALDNQTISPGSIIFEAVPRKKFKIN